MIRLSPQDLDRLENEAYEADVERGDASFLVGSGSVGSSLSRTVPREIPREKPRDSNMVARPGRRGKRSLDQIERYGGLL